MSKTFNYGVYGVGRIGKVHAAIVKEQGQQIVALSAQNNGARYRLQRFDDLQEYEMACLANRLLED